MYLLTYRCITACNVTLGSKMAHIHYSNCFMHKCNSCSWQAEHHIISRMEVYNSVVNFIKEIAHVHYEIWIFKNHAFCIIIQNA